ncbi:BON domain-containing protein [Cribrihabitans pelagius]|uniref:BON domain-containing protein n=1 Tax=Cribrihabitans pelagius TaxID=1765746 RepID=UPI003B59F301
MPRRDDDYDRDRHERDHGRPRYRDDDDWDHNTGRRGGAGDRYMRENYARRGRSLPEYESDYGARSDREYRGRGHDALRGGQRRSRDWDDHDQNDRYSASQGYRRGYAGDSFRSSEGYDDRWSDRDRHGRGDDRRGWGDRAADEVRSWFGDDDAERRRERDHRGRGPKNYQRSDARIEEDVNDRLTDDSRLDASEIEVSVSDREVHLSGTVSSKAEKRRAEDCADDVSGVEHVQNNLRVVREGEEIRTIAGGKA